jgi:pyridoxal phosphate enzyme (YggS family)
LEQIAVVTDRIAAACKKCGRNEKEVKLLLATKTVSAEKIKIALEAGYQLIGENKIQEVKEKYEPLRHCSHTGHFIGHLQTNKVKELLKYNIKCLESLDRLELAEKLQHRLEFEDKYLDVLIQVNTSGEQSKFGVSADRAIELVQQIATLKRLRIKGLMTIGLFSAEEQKIRTCFQLLQSLSRQIAALEIEDVQMQELSMGMSNDLEIAIEQGATIVRVGTAVFGKRIFPDSYYWSESSD